MNVSDKGTKKLLWIFM